MTKKSNDPVGSIHISPEEEKNDPSSGGDIPIPPISEEIETSSVEERDEEGDDALFASTSVRRKIPSPLPGRILTIFFVFLVLLIFYTLIGFVAVPYWFQSVLPAKITEQTNRPVTVGGSRFNPFTFKISLNNTIIGPDTSNPNDRIDPLFSAASIEADMSLSSLFGKNVKCSRLAVDGLFFHLVRNNEQKYNITKILPLQKASTFPYVQLPFSCFLRNITVTNSQVLFDDLPTGKKHNMEQINIALPLFFNSFGEGGAQRHFSGNDQFVNPQFSAIFNGSPIDIKGTTTVEGDAFEARLQLHLDKIDLPSYLPYLPGLSHIGIDTGVADMLMELTFLSAPGKETALEIETVSQLANVKLRGMDNNISTIPQAIIRGTFFPLMSSYLIKEISISKPEVHIGRLADGKWFMPGSGEMAKMEKKRNDQAVSANTAGDAKISVQKRFEIPDVTVEQVSITDGKLSFVDQYVKGGFFETLTNLDVTLTKSGDAKKQLFPFSLKGVTSHKNTIEIRGEALFSPLRMSGVLSGDTLALAQFSSYLPLAGNLLIKKGAIEQFQCGFEFTGAAGNKKHSLVFQDLSADVSSFAMGSPEQNWLSFPEARISFDTLDPADSRIGNIKIEAQQAEMFVQWDKENRLNWAGVSERPGAKARPWQFSLPLVDVKNATLHIRDHSLPAPFILDLRQVDIMGENISNAEKNKGKVTLAAKLGGEQGELVLEGSVSLAPFSALFACKVKDSLQVNSALLREWFAADISGSILAQGEVKLPQMTYSGSLALQNVKADIEKERWIGWNRAESPQIDFTLQPFAMTVSDLSVFNPLVHWTISSAQPESRIKDTFLSSQGRIEVNAINLSDGILELIDTRATPPFDARLKVSGTIRNLKNEKTNKIQLDLQTTQQENQKGEIQGDIGLFDDSVFADIKANFANQQVERFSPYLESLFGYRFNRGLFAFSTSYLQQEDKVIADNILRAVDFHLGPPVDLKSGLPLTIAILSPRTGEISLHLPLSGTTTDSSYSYPAALGRVMRNLVLKTTVSPFAQLRAALPEFKDVPEHILFAAGEAVLSERNKKSLDLLGKILEARPLLTLEVKGFATDGVDREALLKMKRESAFQKKIRLEKKKSSQISKNYGNEEILPSFMTKPDSAEKADSLSVATSELLQLARKREDAVFEYLAHEVKVEKSRVFIDRAGTIVPADALGRPGNRVDFKLGAKIGL